MISIYQAVHLINIYEIELSPYFEAHHDLYQSLSILFYQMDVSSFIVTIIIKLSDRLLFMNILSLDVG